MCTIVCVCLYVCVCLCRPPQKYWSKGTLCYFNLDYAKLITPFAPLSRFQWFPGSLPGLQSTPCSILTTRFVGGGEGVGMRWRSSGVFGGGSRNGG